MGFRVCSRVSGFRGLGFRVFRVLVRDSGDVGGLGF